MGEVIHLKDFQKRVSSSSNNTPFSDKPAGEPVVELHKKEQNYVSLAEDKQKLLRRMQNTPGLALRSQALESAREYFKGWSESEINDFINRTDDFTIKSKPGFFLYAFSLIERSGILSIPFDEMPDRRDDFMGMFKR